MIGDLAGALSALVIAGGGLIVVILLSIGHDRRDPRDLGLTDDALAKAFNARSDRERRIVGRDQLR